ncbi:hypothetical protein Tco_0551110 [Tanacetum coccineum]
MTNSDKEENAEPDVDPLIKLTKAAATAAAASDVPTNGSHDADILPGSSIPPTEFAGGSDVPDCVLWSLLILPTRVNLLCWKKTLQSEKEYLGNERKIGDSLRSQEKQLAEKLLPTGLGSINVFYKKDNSRKCFTSLREILHLVTRADLMTIYVRVMTFYQDHQAAGVGLVLWGDLKVLIDSPEVNDGSDVWKNQNTWSIQSWKLYSYSGVHVLETVDGLVLHMFVDKKYPLSVNLIERMLDHQLEIYTGTMGNELTTAVQLIAFLKKQISDSRRPKVHDRVSPDCCFQRLPVKDVRCFAIHPWCNPVLGPRIISPDSITGLSGLYSLALPPTSRSPPVLIAKGYA